LIIHYTGMSEKMDCGFAGFSSACFHPKVRMPNLMRLFFVALFACWAIGTSNAQSSQMSTVVHLDQRRSAGDFALAERGRATAVFVAPESSETVRVTAKAFADDVQRVTGVKPQILSTLGDRPPKYLVIVGVIGNSAEIDRMRKSGRLQTTSVDGRWESAVIATVDHPRPGILRALVIAGSDRRGAAFALFTISRQMGVSPWTWWADVPVRRHAAVYVSAVDQVQPEPSVRYRGIFLNDEDWGLRPWAAKKMDSDVGNIGPRTYERVFELLLRLHANTLWPAMHPGTLAFNALPENARLADRWGIVMGSSHSEALLRNNVGEWDEKRDGPWNYQTNRAAIDSYWEKRLTENGRYENFYTVGMRGVHDSGLEATGSVEVKARLVEDVMTSQRDLLQKHVDADIAKVPQVIWLYKESLELYRAGMRVPDDVTLGWTDDNYGYLRQLPTVAEQQRVGGSGIYYHVSYWGFPHDYLWLCTTPPALIREEMTKAYDHNARRFWVLNVGDLKPAEADIDYFMQLAWDEPRMAQLDQRTFLKGWAAEQFPRVTAPAIAEMMQRYYQLNFVRKPEFMGFNGYDDEIKRTDFNPIAWGDQNRTRLAAWARLREDEATLARTMPPEYQNAFFELVAYPIEAAAAQNEKFLFADRSFLDASQHKDAERRRDAAQAQAGFDRIQSLTVEYNRIAGGKWEGMMSDMPRNREVFKMPRTATMQDGERPLPSSWIAEQPAAQIEDRKDFLEKNATVSINAAHFAKKYDGETAQWSILPDLGISGGSVVYGAPGKLANTASIKEQRGDAPWLEYDFETRSTGAATLTLHLLPTFALDSQHRLGYSLVFDGEQPILLDASGSGEWKETSAPTWSANVLRNSAVSTVQLGKLRPGRHTLRLIYRDPGVVFEHIVITFAGGVPAYPVPPETRATAEIITAR
jgi:Glycosyl hydrolase family 115/Gylcosyl hydrolase family 115 C-terminal domain